MTHPPGRHRAERPRRPRRALAAVAAVVSVAVIGGGAVVAATHGSDSPERAAGEPTSGPPGPTTSAPAAMLATLEAEPAPDLLGDETVGNGGKGDVVPQSGPGEFLAAQVPDDLGDPIAGAIEFTVEVEKGLPFSPSKVAKRVRAVLDDERSWRGVNGQRFSQVTSGQDLRILIASPDTTDNLCYPLDTAGEVSCRQGDLVILNAKRWAIGVEQYDGDLTAYRTYLVNHEVGHFLGHSHRSCTGDGDPAPVMMQQTYGLDECVANPWPTVA